MEFLLLMAVIAVAYYALSRKYNHSQSNDGSGSSGHFWDSHDGDFGGGGDTGGD